MVLVLPVNLKLNQVFKPHCYKVAINIQLSRFLVLFSEIFDNDQGRSHFFHVGN